MIEDFLELSKDEKLTLEARNEARLAVARLRYERKDFEGALKAYEMVQLPALDPGPGHPLPGGGLDPVQPRAAPGDHRSAHHPGRAELPRRVPARQVHPPGAGLPRPLPLPAGQARGQGAQPPLQRLAGGHPRARRPDPGPPAAPRRGQPRQHQAGLAVPRVAQRGGRAPRPVRRRLRRPALHAPHQGLRPGARRGRAHLPAAAPRRGARGGGQAAPGRRAGAADGVRGRPQALRARQARGEARPDGEGAAAHRRRRSPSSSTASTGTTSSAATG